MENLLIYVLFGIGFVLLVKGADWLVDGASSIARRLNVSDLVIGLTIVAFGTSTPELAVNLIASFEGNSEIAIGNILGSNIANILLILGVAGLIRPLTVHGNTIWKEIPLSFLAALVVGIQANDVLLGEADRNLLSTSDGLVLIAFFVIFLVYVFQLARSGQMPVDTDEIPVETATVTKATLMIVVGLVGLVLGGRWIVGGAVLIARNFGVSESLIGLTIVAVGTSLPEMAASTVAAYKGKSDIAIGNIVGSNIFNIFWILGISASIKSLPFLPGSTVDVGMTMLASLLLMVALLNRQSRLERWHAVGFLLVYGGYLVYLGNRG